MSYHSYRNSDLPLYALIGGPILLAWGLRRFREKRLIENTPTSKVRSAAIGMVELAGMARQYKPLKSPVSQLDACWWDVQVQELTNSGKSSHWTTLTRQTSQDLFYLEDSTGRVLVNPMGAELRVVTFTHALNSMTQSQLSPVLNGWGIHESSWFGGTRQIRILEKFIPECAPLYILGELISTANRPYDRQEKLVARLRSAKSDPAIMAQADVNKDGAVDAQEWDALRNQVEQSLIHEDIARHAQAQHEAMTLISAPASGSYLIATETEANLLSSGKWRTLFAVYGGIALTGFGVWIALLQNWEATLIVGLVAIGLVVSLFFKKLNLNFILRR